MDEVPAGPASPEPRRLSLSVVIPVYNGGRDFECCLRRLRDSDATDFEIIVVDDGSTDGSGALAESFGARVVRHDTPQGPAAARNLGAKLAQTPLVFFLDADVAVHRDTVSRILGRFRADPGLSALFGSYDDLPTAPGLVSQYRNLLHHFVHHQGVFVDDARPAKTFWTGCGAIRRQDFLDHGGFDPGLYRRPAIEDIELGYRMTRAGLKIILARDVQGAHMKRWTLRNVIKTDIFQRGVPWMLLMKRSHVQETDLNVKPGQKVCVAAAGLLTLSLPMAPFRPWALVTVPLTFLALVALNRDFYGLLARRRGWAFAIAAVPLHFAYFCCCGLSVVIAEVLWRFPGLSPESPGINVIDGFRKDPAEGTSVPAPAGNPGASADRVRRPSRWTKT
ncbi:MAG: glycosyltransferase [Paludisphaera borealis]|uniref:glycosyltransferase family 2 protein n=1 Tax=Paludisphaera borealis TaxID=1387353 RepID=UPI0028416D86|nr:glycosyltransferase [Paludisphaera borealis]MDR3623443.1 glycosyltransferase [Paludisphaera borealis]